MTGRFTDNPSYVEYEKLLIQLHHTIARGMGEADEADNIRELMEVPEKQLNRVEINRLNGLSRDLYLLQNQEVLDSPIPPDLTMDGLREQLREAEIWNDWGAVLGLLRRRPVDVPPEAVAVTRSKAYSTLGHPEPAIIFLDFAYRAKTIDPDYRALRLLLIRDAGRLSEAVEQAKQALAEGSSPAQLIVAAADVLLQAAIESPANFQLEDFRRILQAIQPLVIRRTERMQVPPSYLVMACLIQGAALSALGRETEVLDSLDAAVAIDPGDSVLRKMRDQLRAKKLISDSPQAFIDTALQHRRDLLRRESRPQIQNAPTSSRVTPLLLEI